MKDVSKMSAQARWIVGGLIIVLTFGALALNQGYTGFEGFMVRRPVNVSQNLTLEQCTKIRAIWERGDWTGRYGSTAKPAACKVQYPDLWDEPQEPEAEYNRDQCIYYRELWDRGEWTRRHYPMDKPRGCSALYPELWSGPSRQTCLNFFTLNASGHWSMRPHNADELLDICRDTYPGLER